MARSIGSHLVALNERIGMQWPIGWDSVALEHDEQGPGSQGDAGPCQVGEVMTNPSSPSLLTLLTFPLLPISRWSAVISDVNALTCSPLPISHCLASRSNVNALEFSSDGSLLVSGSLDETLRIHSCVTGACLAVLEGHSGAVTALALAAPVGGGKLECIASASL